MHGGECGHAFFLDDVDVLLASRWIRKSSSAFYPSRSKTLHVGFYPPLVPSFSCDPGGAADFDGRPDIASL